MFKLISWFLNEGILDSIDLDPVLQSEKISNDFGFWINARSKMELIARIIKAGSR